ncbi:hypothetical protein F0L68_26440 [Solihabitans fulvus]|uniref:Uncharacterized protein n=1 Tax=Solihabitans fulvus TaxID=1892852 RepID=A0A5B2X0I8_9PSEU|nr:hypothetical protein F0L68_26440 [Solihabitans fulvus]
MGGAGGGSDPGPGKGKGASGTVVAAAVVAGLMAAAGGGTATESVGAALDSAAQQGAKADPAKNKGSANRESTAEAWQRIALREVKKVVTHDLRCAVQSYGQVQQFFLRTPCDSLSQLLTAVADAQGDVIVVSVRWVTMASTGDANALRQLEDTYGTGDVTPFDIEALQLGGIRFTGQHYKSRQDGPLFVIAEAEPVRGAPSAALLGKVADLAVVLPPL